MLSDRQKNLFRSIVETHVRSAAPVGSEILLAKTKSGLSSATIRNEMAVLEEEGLLAAPFTSAGRVPTQAGYEYYIAEMLDTRKSPPKRFSQSLGKRPAPRDLAKELSALTGASVFVGFGPRDTYYTGISNLFSNPEFENYDLALSISAVVDALDESMAALFRKKLAQVEVLVGTNNPLHDSCSLILGRLAKDSLIGIFGPMRMDYQKAYAALNFATTL